MATNVQELETIHNSISEMIINCNPEDILKLTKNKEKFICSDCSRSYSYKHHLIRHIRTSHSEKPPDKSFYRCPTCLKIFSYCHNLKRHIKITHEYSDAEKKYICNTCGRTFKQEHKFYSHMFQHTGVKAFKCELCDEEFIRSYDLRRHLRNHKNYQCSVCNEVFNHFTPYREHLRSQHYNEFICKYCSKAFSHRDYIVKHLKTHNTVVEKSVYSCEYEHCTKSYTKKWNLQQHVDRVHLQVTHDCFCGAKLSTKAKLQQHMKQHLPKTTSMSKKSERKIRKDAGKFVTSTSAALAGFGSDLFDHLQNAVSAYSKEVREVVTSTSEGLKNFDKPSKVNLTNEVKNYSTNKDVKSTVSDCNETKKPGNDPSTPKEDAKDYVYKYSTTYKDVNDYSTTNEGVNKQTRECYTTNKDVMNTVSKSNETKELAYNLSSTKEDTKDYEMNYSSSNKDVNNQVNEYCTTNEGLNIQLLKSCTSNKIKINYIDENHETSNNINNQANRYSATNDETASITPIKVELENV